MNMMTAARMDAVFRMKPYEKRCCGSYPANARQSARDCRFNRDDTGRHNAVTVFEKFDYKNAHRWWAFVLAVSYGIFNGLMRSGGVSRLLL